MGYAKLQDDGMKNWSLRNDHLHSFPPAVVVQSGSGQHRWHTLPAALPFGENFAGKSSYELGIDVFMYVFG